MYNNIVFDNLSYKESVDKIVNINEEICEFWSNARGWAPIDAADLLSDSRLDWLVSLSYSLYRWEYEPVSESRNGDLILAWTNLGALVEGSMKVFLSVYYEDYIKDTNIIKNYGENIDPDSAMFNRLIIFFNKSIWTNDEKEERNKWLELIRDRRNAIHAYQHKDIEDFNAFHKQVKQFVGFLYDINSRLPYPDM